jgi:hypothetical protein
MRIEEIRTGLVARLRKRREEIERAILNRVYSVSDSAKSPDPEYADGLRAAVAAAVEYGIEAVERSEDRPPPTPTVLLSQARLAARHGVELETVLRRYVAGYTLLGDFLIEESERGGPLNGASLKRLLRVLAALLDRLILAVSEEYARELQARPGSPEQRRAERVERLLAGEFVDDSELAYDLDATHIGLIASGHGAAAALEGLAKALERRLLLVRRREGVAWAWLGAVRKADLEQLPRLLRETWPAQVALALGQPGQGVDGWRLTHQQAQATLPVALRSPEAFARYADVALLASLLQDDLLATSLRRIYLDPLRCERDGGELARATLRAYFAAERNVSSAAAALGVNRHTVAKRLRVAEELLDRPLSSCAAELEAALRLEEFG